MTPTQELPPATGFPAIPYKRHLPSRGPPSWTIAVAILVYVGWSTRRFNKRYYIERELKREEMQFEFLIGSLLLAEEDLKFLKRRYELLKFAKDSNLQVDFNFYRNKRYESAAIPLF